MVVYVLKPPQYALLLKYNLGIDKLYLDPEAITFNSTSWAQFKFLVSNYMKL